MRSKLLFRALIALALPFAAVACNERALEHKSEAGAVGSLSAEQAARVVAKAGDRAITLGEFARVLERMDQFDRLRYQSKERRRELLDEIVDVELLAAEAKRRGLENDPDVQDAIRVILRDAMLAKAREGLPTPAGIPEAEVRAYYDGHLDRFTEPERRRVAAIVMNDKKEAEKVQKDALKVKSANEWGELFFKHSTTAPKTKGPTNPAELAGDLGIVGPPSDAKGGSAKVPPAVRALAFKLKTVGEVAADLVEVEGKFFIVRLNGITPGHKRTFAEAERSIRVLILQDMMQERERALEEELKKKFPVQVDDKALEGIKLPAELEKWDGTGASQVWPAGSGAPDAGPPAPPDGGK